MSIAAPSTARPGQFRMPPLGLAAALILWGIENQVWPYAAVMAVVLEAARWVPWRWHLSDKDFNRLSDATALGLLLVVVYVFDTYSFHGVYVVLQWLPFVLFLLAVAQRYGTRQSIRYSALFLSVRRAERKGVVRDPGEINFDLPYLVTCLVSATGGTIGGFWLFAGLAGVLGYLLWYNRPRKLRAAIWFCVMFTAIGLGYLNQLGLLEARRIAEPVIMDFFRDRISGYRDPFRSYTAMGEIGRMKLSDRIVLRVTDEDGHGIPTLLRESAYRIFSKNIWMAGSSKFEEQIPDVEGTTWALEPVPLQGSRTIRIARSMFRGKALLAVPDGTFQIEDLPVEVLERHPLGALKVKRGPGLLRYTARYAPGRNFELPPGPQDLVVPGDLEGLMSQVTHDLNLKGAPVQKAIQELSRYFLTRFKYSVTLRRPGPVATPLHSFLLETRTGHCEFFASATVLLLRHLGIPSRYATGYSVQEYSPLEKSYIVRRRHAHSWALAYVDGRWIDLDTTPSVWADLEADAAPWWEGGYDLLSWLGFQFSRWRWRADEDEASNEALWLIVPLLGILLWRLSRTERISRRRRGKRPALTSAIKPGADSDLYELVKALSRRGLEREPGESLRRWLGRLGRQGKAAGVEEIVAGILPIHYRYRFDPQGISAEDRDILRRRSRDWLKRHAT
jgi:hypothetical protein